MIPKDNYLLLLCLLHVLLVAIVVDGPIVMGFDMNGFYFVALVNFLGISHCFEDYELCCDPFGLFPSKFLIVSSSSSSSPSSPSPT